MAGSAAARPVPFVEHSVSSNRSTPVSAYEAHPHGAFPSHERSASSPRLDSVGAPADKPRRSSQGPRGHGPPRAHEGRSSRPREAPASPVGPRAPRNPAATPSPSSGSGPSSVPVFGEEEERALPGRRAELRGPPRADGCALPPRGGSPTRYESESRGPGSSGGSRCEGSRTPG